MTVSRVLRTVKRPPSQTWKVFLQNHIGEIVAIDFFMVPTIRLRVLFVFLVLEHQRRKVLHFGVTEHPGAEWAGQQVVEALAEEGTKRYLVHDRDATYGNEFRRRIQSLGMKEVISAPRSPGRMHSRRISPDMCWHLCRNQGYAGVAVRRRGPSARQRGLRKEIHPLAAVLDVPGADVGRLRGDWLSLEAALFRHLVGHERDTRRECGNFHLFHRVARQVVGLLRTGDVLVESPFQRGSQQYIGVSALAPIILIPVPLAA